MRVTAELRSLGGDVQKNATGTLHVRRAIVDPADAKATAPRPWPVDATPHWQPPPAASAGGKDGSASEQRGEILATLPFSTGPTGTATVDVPAIDIAGAYTIELVAADDEGRPVMALAATRVVDPDSATAPLGSTTHNLVVSTGSAQPGDMVVIVWSTSAASGRAYMEVEHRQRAVVRLWTPPGSTQHVVRFDVNESHRGGFTVNTFQVLVPPAHCCISGGGGGNRTH